MSEQNNHFFLILLQPALVWFNNLRQNYSLTFPSKKPGFSGLENDE